MDLVVLWSQWQLALWGAGLLLQRFGIPLVFCQNPGRSIRIALEKNYSQGLNTLPHPSHSCSAPLCAKCSHNCPWVIINCPFVISSSSLGYMKLSSAAIPELVLGLCEMPSLKRLMWVCACSSPLAQLGMLSSRSLMSIFLGMLFAAWTTTVLVMMAAPDSQKPWGKCTAWRKSSKFLLSCREVTTSATIWREPDVLMHSIVTKAGRLQNAHVWDTLGYRKSELDVQRRKLGSYPTLLQSCIKWIKQNFNLLWDPE